MVKKKGKKEKKEIMKIKNNVFRSIYHFSNKYIDFKKVKGFYYVILHQIIIIFYMFLTLFCNSIYHLIVLLCIIAINTLGIALMNECPLTKLEKKYLHSSATEKHLELCKKLNINYECNHVYETNLNSITIIGSLVILKLFIIIFFKLFQIKIANHDVYV